MSNENKKKNGKLLVTVCLITVITITFLTLAQILSIRSIVRNEIKKDSSVQYETICKTSSSLCATLIDEYLSKLNYYTNAEVVLNGGSTEEIVEWLCSERVKELKPDVFDYIGFVDISGNNYADSGATSDVSDRDYYKAIAGGENRFIDNPTTSRATGKKIIHVCKAVKQYGKTIGLFYGAVNPDLISTMLAELIKLGDAGYAVAFGGDGSVVGTSTVDEFFEKELESVKSNNPEAYAKIEQAWLAQSDYDADVNFDGGKTLLVGNPVKKTEWNLVLFLKEDVIFNTSTLVSKSLIIGGVILCLIIILVIIAVLFVSIKPLSVVEETIRGIATGDADLTQRINIHSNNEIGRVVEGFNLFSEKLQTIIATMKASKEDLMNVGDLLQNSSEDTSSAIIQIIGNIESMGKQVSLQSESVHETAGAVNQIASNIESLNRMIESQSSAVEEASAAVEEMIGNINSVNKSVQKMAGSFEELEGKAVIGVQKQNDVNAKIEEIQIESQALREANTVIKGIAEQTNLLAMNAAIEAAHAGEAGKGFSVVADEIRKLSEDSGTQSQTIGDQLDKIIGSIEQIVDASMTASDSFNEVSTGINSTTNLVREITNAMTEQNEGSKQIAIALNSMNDTSNEVKTASIEMAEGNKAILDEIKTLQDSSYNIKCGMDEMSNGARKINETGVALADLTNKMKESITNIGTQVDRFKV